MPTTTYLQPRSDPQVVAILIKLRADAGLTQAQAARAIGLEGAKSRDSFSAWESGMSVPRQARRPDFLNYLLDGLRLRSDPARFEEVWSKVMVSQWGWPVVSDAEWSRLFPGRSRGGALASHPPAGRVVEPPHPVFPPNVDSFVGRAGELERAEAALREVHRLAFVGMPGAGKTWLAAYLAIRMQRPERIFWHTFREGEDGVAMIWRLAAFLYWRGRQDLWMLMQGGGQPGANPRPPELLVDYLAEWLPRGGYLLCLDDFQCVDEDPLVDAVLDRLAPALDSGKLSLLLTSRRIPPLRADAPCWSLAGLTADDASEFLARRGASLSPDLAETLRAATEGNPAVLSLAATELRAGTDPRRLIPALGQTDSIARYLSAQVDKHLTDAERDALIAVAIAGPCAREAIEDVSGVSGVAQTLRRLQDADLLRVIVGEDGREYDLNALLRPFYLDALSSQRRSALRVRAGEHYERAGDALAAARHFLDARQHARAALLAAPNVYAAANRGQLHVARQVLQGLTAASAATARWPAVWTALGQVHALIRETSAARQALERADTLLAPLPDSANAREQKAAICRHMAELLKFDAPREAIKWLDRGLAAVSGSAVDPAAVAALHAEAGSVYSKLGEFPVAIGHLEQALALLPAEPTGARAAALINLGIVYCTQGKTDQGVECYQRSIEVSEAIGDSLRVLSARHNLGIEMDIGGEWEAAASEYRWALDLAERLGSRTHLAEVTLSSGILETKRGSYAAAGELLSRSVAMASDLGLEDHRVAAQSSLAQLELRRGQAQEAADLLLAAEALANELEARDQLPEILRGRAEAALALGQTDAALALVQQSIGLARELDMDMELGMSQRVLGQALDAMGQDPLAVFEASLALLRDQDPYEAARTEHQWGCVLLRQGEKAKSETVLASALTAFKELGAGGDLADIAAALERLP